MKQVQLFAKGAPHEVCRLVDAPDPGPPGPGEAVVRIMGAAINPADLLGFEGRYPGPEDLPAPVGIEGAGIIEAAEGGDLTPGDHVIVLTRANWAERVRGPQKTMIRIPKDLPWRDAAQLKANPPSAWLMLRDYRTLKPGDWVVQNAANSAVGLHLIRFAREMGVKTANIVRRPELIAPLKAHGADVVLLGGPDQAERLRAEIGDAPVPLGIDAMGGAPTRWMAECLSDGAALVNYGYLAGAPAEIEPGHLIVRGITLTGFWLVGFSQRASREEKTALYGDMAHAFIEGRLVSPVEAVYPLTEIETALRRAAAGGRGGKILLAPNGPI